MKKVGFYTILVVFVIGCQGRKISKDIKFVEPIDNSTHHVGIEKNIYVDMQIFYNKSIDEDAFKRETQKFYSALKRCYFTTKEKNGLHYATFKNAKMAKIPEEVYEIYSNMLKEHNDYVLTRRKEDPTFNINENSKNPINMAAYSESLYTPQYMRQLLDKYGSQGHKP